MVFMHLMLSTTQSNISKIIKPMAPVILANLCLTKICKKKGDTPYILTDCVLSWFILIKQTLILFLFFFIRKLHMNSAGLELMTSLSTLLLQGEEVSFQETVNFSLRTLPVT